MAMSQKAWYDKAFVSISAASGSEVTMQANTTTFSVTGGNSDVEGIETFGGKIARVASRDDIEVSFDGIPVSIREFDWLFQGQTSQASATGSVSLSTSTISTPYRVTILWTNYTASNITAATTPVTGTAEAYRLAYANAYCTALEKSMDAGDRLNAKISFKLADQDENGVQNWLVQSKDTTSGTLSALSAFTTTVKGW